MKHMPFFLLLLATPVCVGTAHANSALFEVLDRDDSGYLTLEETQGNPRLRLRFSQIDRNQNDRLEVEELQLFNVAPAFSDFDTDENLGINPQEASTLRELLNEFSQLDTDENQVLDPGEFSQFTPDS